MAGFLESTPLRNLFYNPEADEEAQQAGLEEARQAYANMPEVQFGQMAIQGPQEAGDVGYAPVTGQTAEAALAGPSAYRDINIPPEYREAQMQQLAALNAMRQAGGLTAQDQANLAQIEAQQLATDRAQREAVLQRARMTGTATGGQALMSQLAAQQAAAQQANQQGLQVAGMAQNRALQAGQAAAGLGAGLEQQAYGEEAARAAAEDAIARFNAQNATGMNQFNAQQANAIAAQNAAQNLAAQQFNVGKSQAVKNAEAQAGAQNQYYNQFAMPQQQYQNALSRAQGLAGVGSRAADIGMQRQQSAEQAQSGMWGGLTKLGAAGINKWGSHGGRVPGLARLSGDSLANDTALIHASPGEVVVPRSLAMSNNPKAIATFVQHAPDISTPDKRKEAMLSALKNMRRKGRR